ncbi:MAG: SBBP repeat-containing protein [Candidatus Zixiibacteriota bacterium]
MIRKLILSVILVLISVPNVVSWSNHAFAESVDTAWVRRYDGPGSGGDYAVAIATDSSNNVYVTGRSEGSGTGIDYATIKYYPNGDTAWVRRYNGPGNGYDEARDIAVDDSGYVYVTGYSTGSGTDYDYATIKYHPNGDTAWTRRYNGSDNSGDMASSLALDNSGNVYVTGGSWSSVTSTDFATIKYYPNGDTAWVRKYSRPLPFGDVDRGEAITLDDSGCVYVTGYSNNETNTDCATIKYYPNGDTAWVRICSGSDSSFDYGNLIAVDDSGNVYVAGESSLNPDYPYKYDYLTIKYYPTGDTAWVRRYNGPGNDEDEAFGLVLGGSGCAYVTGKSKGNGTSNDYATIKYSPHGDTAWVRRYDCPTNDDDEAYAMAVDDSGNIYVTGYVDGWTHADYGTIKYFPNGDTAWMIRSSGPGSFTDYPSAMTVDRSGNVYVTGVSAGSGTGNDYFTIKYVQTPSGVRDETGSRQKPSEFALSQNYPNPFNPTTKIEFTLSKSGFVTLQIYDVMGRKVRTLVAENLPSGYKSVIWDGKNDAGKDVASGVYFYQLKVGDFSEPKKMVLLK